MITNHTQLLQALIDKHGLKSYLEIGVQNPANNFDKIKCERKIGVDPDMSLPDVREGPRIVRLESDEFFRSFNKVNDSGGEIESNLYNHFDIVFLDGLHTAEQVKRDFENSLRCLSDNGFIVIHDVLPKFEETTKVPRQTRCWHGTVYQFCLIIKETYDGISFKTYDIDEGCMVIHKSISKRNTDYALFGEVDWTDYLKYKNILLNVLDEVSI